MKSGKPMLTRKGKDMPRYVIERQFLVPVYEHILVEAPSLEVACREALDDIAQPWEESEICWDDARETTIAQAVELPETVEPELRPENANRHDLSLLLYDSGLELLRVPEEFAEITEETNAGVGFS
jgi:hypothetical protein